jgi:hypothetical protein
VAGATSELFDEDNWALAPVGIAQAAIKSRALKLRSSAVKLSEWEKAFIGLSETARGQKFLQVGHKRQRQVCRHSV